MKRILLSLVVVSLLAASAVAATRAYFSSGRVLGDNTFSTGDVLLGDAVFQGLGLTVQNMAPGVTYTRDVNLQYNGSLPADIYLGVGGSPHQPTDPDYFGTILKARIFNRDNTSEVYFDDYIHFLSSSWHSIAANISQGNWKHYRIEFTLDSTTANQYQGQENKDTTLMFYSVQTGGTTPAGAPHTLLGTAPFTP